ncbi:hypothetical protein [uncultured Jatrophihabitans sp.]|uniref:hypothetical protein n=1 Tax=uncultured Jatrophihabitans sp. TaxID=1610747 RepID=UPI0035CBF4C3
MFEAHGSIAVVGVVVGVVVGLAAGAALVVAAAGAAVGPGPVAAAGDVAGEVRATGACVEAARPGGWSSVGARRRSELHAVTAVAASVNAARRNHHDVDTGSA